MNNQASIRHPPPPFVLWFTGLSGSGKTTLSEIVVGRLRDVGIPVLRLDGDELRQELCKDLGFSIEDRRTNVLRAGAVARLAFKSGISTAVALISPMADDRRVVREYFPPGSFSEIYVRATVETCGARDPKGLYERARQGLVRGVTGLDSPYQVPTHPDWICDTTSHPPEVCVDELMKYIERVHLKAHAEATELGSCL